MFCGILSSSAGPGLGVRDFVGDCGKSFPFLLAVLAFETCDAVRPCPLILSSLSFEDLDDGLDIPSVFLTSSTGFSAGTSLVLFSSTLVRGGLGGAFGTIPFSLGRFIDSSVTFPTSVASGVGTSMSFFGDTDGRILSRE